MEYKNYKIDYQDNTNKKQFEEYCKQFSDA